MLVALLACPKVQLLDVAGPADVFAEACHQLGDPKAYRLQLISTGPRQIRSSCGLSLMADTTLASQRGNIDTLLVAGSADVDMLVRNKQAHAWIARQARKVRRLGSVCSGAFCLANAGLLAGKTVTTHWRFADRLSAEHPEVNVSADAIFLRDGALYTSAGVTAGMDLALALVEEDHGRDLALRVARQLVMFLKRPGGQSQYSAHLEAQTAERSSIRQIQERVLGKLTADLSVPALAAQAGMSERNFARVFRSEAGLSPAEFVEKARIDAARRLLEDSPAPLKRVADTVGYANVDGFRRAFQRRVGVAPTEYRRRFRG